MVSVGGQLQGCAWILKDPQQGGLCSACATLPQLVFAILAPEDPLSAIPRAGEGTTVRELADWTTRSTAQIRRALARLESRGLAERGGQLVDGSIEWYRTEAS
jgi:hypothetical protein